MQCCHCQSEAMYLKRFDGAREIWACRDCGEEAVRLDCQYCEKRGFYLHALHLEGNRWRCEYCRTERVQCPLCGKGWLQLHGSELCCNACHQCQTVAPEGDCAMFQTGG